MYIRKGYVCEAVRYLLNSGLRYYVAAISKDTLKAVVFINPFSFLEQKKWVALYDRFG